MYIIVISETDTCSCVYIIVISETDTCSCMCIIVMCFVSFVIPKILFVFLRYFGRMSEPFFTYQGDTHDLHLGARLNKLTYVSFV